ncbi:hypothetical protein [Caballeronia udeis]|uniref:hypothetical protein n=1 Tax=Caballeronia udeis TaxID=1232866 RepID=UPI00384C7DD2
MSVRNLKRYDIKRSTADRDLLDLAGGLKRIPGNPGGTVLCVTRCEQHASLLVEYTILQFTGHHLEQPRRLIGRLHRDWTSSVVKAKPLHDILSSFYLFMSPNRPLGKVAECVDDQGGQQTHADRERSNAGNPQACGQTSNPVIKHVV